MTLHLLSLPLPPSWPVYPLHLSQSQLSSPPSAEHLLQRRAACSDTGVMGSGVPRGELRRPAKVSSTRSERRRAAPRQVLPWSSICLLWRENFYFIASYFPRHRRRKDSAWQTCWNLLPLPDHTELAIPCCWFDRSRREWRRPPIEASLPSPSIIIDFVAHSLSRTLGEQRRADDRPGRTRPAGSGDARHQSSMTHGTRASTGEVEPQLHTATWPLVHLVDSLLWRRWKLDAANG
jgi:hypothetical protein